MEEVLDHNQEAEQIFRQYGRLLELVAAAQLPGRPEDAGGVRPGRRLGLCRGQGAVGSRAGE